ncbi:MAG TPA: DsrE family protein [Terriglobia bacterium]|nr:DsrE family protein [Candidatus Acidoferrum sp.]HMD85321.1 DsrE family protein [Terriglobia bacterium]
MPDRFCVSITCSKDNCDRATVGFAMAGAAVASGKDTMVFLSVDGVRLSQKGYVDGVQEQGFPPLKELIEGFAKAGGKIYVCMACFKKRGLAENNLVEGATIEGGPKLIEFLSGGAPCISY